MTKIKMLLALVASVVIVALSSCSKDYYCCPEPEPEPRYEGYVVCQKRYMPEGSIGIIYLPSGETSSKPWPEHWTIDIRHNVTFHRISGIWVTECEYNSLKVGDPYRICDAN